MHGEFEDEVLSEETNRMKLKAFYNCRQLKEIHLNEGLTNIGAAAFAQTAIRNIVIPETVTKLGKEVFDSCLYLRDVFIPDSVNCIGEKFFGWVGRGAFIHTTEDAYAVKYMKKNYPLITMFYDYEKKTD